MTPEGKKIWNSPAGGSLMAAMLKLKPLEEKDRETIARLNDLNRSKSQMPSSQPTPPKTS